MPPPRPALFVYRTHCGKLALSRSASILQPYEPFIGLRYTRARQRSRFISFISLVSVIGIALGITVLITVLSVMNGFQREVRTRILSVASHIQISGPSNALADWRAVADKSLENPEGI